MTTLDDDARLYLYADLTLSVDPTGSTVQLEVDATKYAMTWQGTPVAASGVWKQTARTTAKFIGSAVTVTSSDVQLTSGRHPTQALVTMADGQVIPGSSVPLDVR